MYKLNGVLWTIAIEAQLYLLFPGLARLLLLRRSGRPASRLARVLARPARTPQPGVLTRVPAPVVRVPLRRRHGRRPPRLPTAASRTPGRSVGRRDRLARLAGRRGGGGPHPQPSPAGRALRDRARLPLPPGDGRRRRSRRAAARGASPRDPRRIQLLAVPRPPPRRADRLRPAPRPRSPRSARRSDGSASSACRPCSASRGFSPWRSSVPTYEGGARPVGARSARCRRACPCRDGPEASSPCRAPRRREGEAVTFPPVDDRFRLDRPLAEALAARFGTPLYVLGERHLRNRMRAYRDAAFAATPKAEVTYASKANSTLAVLRIAHQEGLKLDVASEGELRAALAAGVPAADCHPPRQRQVARGDRLRAGRGGRPHRRGQPSRARRDRPPLDADPDRPAPRPRRRPRHPREDLHGPGRHEVRLQRRGRRGGGGRPPVPRARTRPQGVPLPRRVAARRPRGAARGGERPSPASRAAWSGTASGPATSTSAAASGCGTRTSDRCRWRTTAAWSPTPFERRSTGRSTP